MMSNQIGLCTINFPFLLEIQLQHSDSTSIFPLLSIKSTLAIAFDYNFLSLVFFADGFHQAGTRKYWSSYYTGKFIFYGYVLSFQYDTGLLEVPCYGKVQLVSQYNDVSNYGFYDIWVLFECLWAMIHFLFLTN